MGIKCATCGKNIEDIEYIKEAHKLVGKSIEEYVRASELVSDANEIICNDCYLTLGLPCLPINELLMTDKDINNKFVNICKDMHRKGVK